MFMTVVKTSQNTKVETIVDMEKDDEFLYGFFVHISQTCFEKAKDHVEKERQTKTTSLGTSMILSQLLQISLAEKSYMEIGFLQNKNKGFLRKDNSLRALYETIKTEVKKIEEQYKTSNQDKKIINYCQNIVQFLTARIHLIDFYEKVYNTGSNKALRFNELLIHIDSIIEKHILGFTDISLTPIKAIFVLECQILSNLFKALTELQRLQFLPTLALIHGAHSRLCVWESKLQNRETWKLGFLKNNQLPLLFQWLLKLKGVILSKYSLYFHDTLGQQTTPSDMRQWCSKLHYDNYQKMVTFQRKYDAKSVLILSDNQVSCDTTEYDCYPIIVSYPQKSLPQVDLLLKMISETASDLAIIDKTIYKFISQEQCSFVLTTIEPNIYLVLIFGAKKTEKDSYISNFILDLCINLRCTKVFLSLKTQSK